MFSVDKQMAENLAQDMSDLMHDFDLVSRYRILSTITVSKYSVLSTIRVPLIWGVL